VQIATERLVKTKRQGPRPRTRGELPHRQLEGWPPASIAADLIERSLELPFVRPRQSRMATPDCRALWLPDHLAGGPQEAFIDEHEFCHLHPLPQGSIHVTLPLDVRTCAIDLGWAEQHPATRSGAMPESLVLLYAPRDREELEVIMRLICCSYEYARWGTE